MVMYVQTCKSQWYLEKQENKLICHPGDENHSDYNNYNFVGIILQIKTQTRKQAFRKPDTVVNKIKNSMQMKSRLFQISE